MKTVEIDRLTFDRERGTIGERGKIVMTLHFTYEVDGMHFFGSVKLTTEEEGRVYGIVTDTLERIQNVISKDLGKEE